MFQKLSRRVVQYLLSSVVMALCAVPALAQQNYPFDTGDRLRIRVHERPDLSGVYVVDTRGEVSIPLLGRIGARGADSASLESAVTSALSRRQSAAAYVAVEVEAYRAVHVDGDVEKPGAYEFKPGLTVRELLALAGGVLSTRSAMSVSPLTRVESKESLESLADAYMASIAREARLVAERDSRAIVRFPKGLTTRLEQARVRELLTSEAQLFQRRIQLIDGLVALLAERIFHFGNQISELREERLVLLRKQTLITAKLAAVKELTTKGAVAQIELLQMEINAVEADRDLRQNSVAILEATLGRNEAQQNITNLRSQRAQDIAEDLLSVRNQLTQNAIRTRNTEQRLQLMSTPASAVAAHSTAPRHRITRRKGGEISQLHATLDTTLYPGDMLTIAFPQPEQAASDTPDRLERISD